jgi:ubiquitin-like modifier-activating enzyme ATG7
MNTDSKMLFATPMSVVDSSFFVELSQRKLNVLKLDTSYQQVIGYFDYRSLGPEQAPHLNIGENSFDEEEKVLDSVPLNSAFLCKGNILNVNSIDEFRNVNKKDFLREAAVSILVKIKDKTFIKDPSVLSAFAALSFADLKKYKFYYWFAFPQLQSRWTTTSFTDGFEFKLKKSETFKQQFYIIDQNGQNLSLLPLSSLFDPSIDRSQLKILFIDTCSYENTSAYILRNFLTALSFLNFENVEIQVAKISYPEKSFTMKLKNDEYNSPKYTDPTYIPPVSGWERTSRGKLGPKLADLGELIDPLQLADQAIDLNLQLMKWRLAPELNLQAVKNSKVLILGAGTLGSYIARCLLAWGVRKISFVDSGKVSFSNPVRQPLFNYEDCLKGGSPKAEAAAANLKKIFPLVDAIGYDLAIPMIGHSIKDEKKEQQEYFELVKLYEEHDAVFICLDSRESRWLPTLLGYSMNKIVINSALGFESYLVIRHGGINPTIDIKEQHSGRLGCYFCNDIVAPKDSLTDRTLDQMCTVTRPGVALMASSLATEMFVSIVESPDKQYTEHTVSTKTNILGSLPHQLRGFLHNFELLKLSSHNFQYCTACSIPVVKGIREEGWNFVKKALNSDTFLEDLTGLKEFQNKAEEAALMMDDFEDDELEDALI